MSKPNKPKQGTGHEPIRSPSQAMLDAMDTNGMGPANGTSSPNDGVTNPIYGSIQPVRSTVTPRADRS